MVIYQIIAGPLTVAPPDGCALCGWTERSHPRFYFGKHSGPDVPRTYVRPDDALRLARMRVRRAERAAAGGCW